MSDLSLAVKNFVAPTPQDALGGRLGLSLEDIASSVGINPSTLRARWRQKDFDGIAWAIVRKSDSSWTISIPAAVAEILVATLSGKIGITYSMWLVKKARESRSAC